MKTFFHPLLLTYCLSLGAAPIFAQNPEKSISEMNWTELTEKWEALASAGKNNLALPYAYAALAKARQDSTEASLAFGNSLDFLGYSLHHTGQYADAELNFKAAVEHARLHLGEKHEDYITRLSNLAMLHMDMGELAKAVSELESAVFLAQKNLEPDNPYLGIMVNNLGLANERVGQLDRALEYLLYALDLTEKTVGKESVRYGTRLLNIASIIAKTGKKVQALEYNQKALVIFEKAVGKEHPNYVNGIHGLMVAYLNVGRYADALALSDTLLVALAKMPVQETVATYDYGNSIASIYFQTGQYERCITFLQERVSKFTQIYPREYARHAYSARLAMASLDRMGRLEEAKAFALLFNQNTLEVLHEYFRKFSEEEQLAHYNTYHQNLDASALVFALRHPEFTELAAGAYEYQMTIKGLSLASRRQLFESLRKSPDSQLFTQFETWQRLQNDISRQFALTPARRQANLDSLLGLANTLERSLVVGSEHFRMANQKIDWRAVQSTLLPNEAAIEFGQIQYNQTDSILYVAWVLRPGAQAPQQVYLFEEKEVGNLAATKRLYAPEVTSGAKNLNQLLWKSLEPCLKNVSTLYFAPAGILHQINLGAVPISNTETMADRFNLHRLISTRLILTLKNEPDHGLPTSALVFGGIQYDSDSLALSANNVSKLVESDLGFPMPRQGILGDHWIFLPGSLAEAKGVRRQLEQVGTQVNFAEGFKASEGYFKKVVQQSPAPTVLHLATHGFFVTALDTNAQTGFGTAKNPMARAGLVLSGANRVWSGDTPLAGQEDGILTALEISRLDLRGAELAVLSACGTGQGKIQAGEGVLGLQRAFKMAGVRYVIMTLWNVQDHDAQQFMGLFYTEWLSRAKSVPEAFHIAQKKMRALHAKPFQPMAWAGFLLLE